MDEVRSRKKGFSEEALISVRGPFFFTCSHWHNNLSRSPFVDLTEVMTLGLPFTFATKGCPTSFFQASLPYASDLHP